MGKTRHIHKRMSQRAINAEMLEIVKQFGEKVGDKTILNNKCIDSAMQELKRLFKQMQRMREKGGIVLVESNGLEITTYALDSYRRP